MKILDLTNLEKSEIEYKIYKFPDGQQNVVITGHYHDHSSVIRSIDTINYDDVQINTRINSFLDLELLACAVACLRELKVKEIHLYCPIIIGSRSDRKFEIGGNNYLRDVICLVINSLKFDSVIVYDAHSTCSEMGFVGHYENISNINLLRFALIPPLYYPNTDDNFILIASDAGATHKIYKLAEQIGYKGDIITCTKERDTEGKLTKTVVPISLGKYIFTDLIIIDDICDGGRTFINIAKEINNQISRITSLSNSKLGKKYLIVSHMLHDTPNPELLEYFDGIYCTNSRHNKYYEMKKDHIIQSEKIKVLNIF